MLNTDLKDGNKPVMTDAVETDGQKSTGISGVLLQAQELTVRTHAGVSLLSDLSFHIEPGELIALTGLSRSGKSTLLRCLAGLMKPQSGEVLIDGVSLYANLKAFRPSIGFVPAEYALQQNLTVAEILREAAVLRLPRRASSQDRRQRVLTLLETVGLTHVTETRVHSLDRVDRRRLSIAVELMGYPGLLLLDDPVEQLTPFEEVQITILLRELSRQGHTVIQSDRRSRSAGLSDKVIFLAPGGLLAWFGPPDESFIYLRSFLPGGIVKDLFGLREAIEVLANPQLHEGVEWAKRFKANPAYQKYVEDPLHNRFPDLMLQTHPLIRLRLRNATKEKLPPGNFPQASTGQKSLLLLGRNLRLLWRDKTVFFMLAVPPLVALLDFVISSAALSNPDRAPVSFGLLIFLILLTAAALVQNEILKERDIYQREHRSSPLLLSYILSKVWVVVLFAIYQGSVWAIIHFLATGLAGGVPVLPTYAITFFLVALIGGIIGLIVSALARTATTITSWMLLLTVPQLILSGAIVPLNTIIFPFNLLSQFNPSRYALETLLVISGTGQGLTMSLLSYWSILALISLLLMVLLLGVQRSNRST